MRVIAGSARGVPLVPPSGGVRPTMDRVRAAVFSSLGDAVPGARVLDLFAGSGGLGIEALSRGATSAVFVDIDPRSVRTIRKNLAKCHLEAGIQSMDAFRFLELYAGSGTYDLIFADPPYAKNPGDRDFAAELAKSDALAGALTDSGTFVLEFGGGQAPEAGAGLRLLRGRKYGESSIAYFVKR
jgi:16S rRNA (guanine966-N2)-methyltransferase